MDLLRSVLARLLRRNQEETEMALELSFHLERRAQDLEDRGMARQEAQRQARIEFGGMEGYKERCRDARGFRLWDELSGDVRFAIRSMRKNLTFTATTVFSLALGIGVNLSCFAALSAMVLHPFSYPDLNRIVSLSATRASSPSERKPAAPADFLDWKRRSRSFEQLAAYRDSDFNLTGVDRPDHISGALASAEFFEVLGTAPLLGRAFTPAECEPGHDAVVVVSRDFWHNRLASDPNAIGRTLTLGGRRYTIAGVMPEQFNLPLAADLWAPLVFTPEQKMQRADQQLAVIGRLRRDVTTAQANTEMNAIARQLAAQYPRTNEQRGVLVTALPDLLDETNDRFMTVLMCAGLFVLLLACTNVGSLQVARVMSRQKELGLRSSLGAGNFRLFRQLFTESVITGLAGGLLGLLLASWHLSIMRGNIPLMIYRIVAGLKDMRINSEVAGYGMALSLAASVLCCIPAILQVIRSAKHTNLTEVLKEGGRNSNASPVRNRLRTTLVVAEVALAFILLVGAGVMTGTLERIMVFDLGYNPHNVLTGRVALTGPNYEQPARVTGFYDGVLRKLEQTGGVEAAAAVSEIGSAEPVVIEGRPAALPGELRPDVKAASPGYLRVMRLPLIEGRWLSAQDGSAAQRVVVVTQAVARHYWPDSNPLGQRVKLRHSDAEWMTVVGVVGDIKDWFFGRPLATAYVAYQQFPQAAAELLLRGHSDSQTFATALRAAAQGLDPEQPVYNVRTIEQQMYEETSGVRNSASMMTTYAGIALLLSVSGIYSISSFFVAQRTREIGVRMSLGATRPAILKMVLRQTFVTTGAGLFIGLPAGILLTAGMSHVLYNIVAVQPLMFVLIVAVLGTAALVAGYIPAQRAANVDPTTALRHE